MPAASEHAILPGSPHEPPGPRGYPLVGVLLSTLRDPLRFLTATARDYGDVSRFRLAHRVAYLINRPEYIERVLQSDEAAYRNGALQGGVRRVFGEGLTFSNGQRWRRDRELMQPFFRKGRIATFSDTFVDAIAQILVSWEDPARRGEAVEMTDQMSRLLHALVIRVFFGDALPQADVEAARSALNFISHELHKYAVVEWLQHLPTLRAWRFRTALATLEAIVARTITARRRSRLGDDLLSRMIEAGFTDQEIRDQVITLLLAGQETSSNALAWTLYLISQHPEVESRLSAELDAVLGGRTPTFESLGALSYLRCVLQESMRLYPPAHLISRLAVADDVIGGYVIRAGSVVFVSQYLMHRHPAYWAEPERFEPDRFSPERQAGRPPFTYFPFGTGRRSCIGSHLAMTEMLFVSAMIYQRYRPRPPPGRQVTPQPGITLRPRGGMAMILEVR
jgi:cytochrome P450